MHVSHDASSGKTVAVIRAQRRRLLHWLSADACESSEQDQSEVPANQPCMKNVKCHGPLKHTCRRAASFEWSKSVLHALGDILRADVSLFQDHGMLLSHLIVLGVRLMRGSMRALRRTFHTGRWVLWWHNGTYCFAWWSADAAESDAIAALNFQLEELGLLEEIERVRESVISIVCDTYVMPNVCVVCDMLGGMCGMLRGVWCVGDMSGTLGGTCDGMLGGVLCGVLGGMCGMLRTQLSTDLCGLIITCISGYPKRMVCTCWTTSMQSVSSCTNDML
jgi:hypothetical protein